MAFTRTSLNPFLNLLALANPETSLARARDVSSRTFRPRHLTLPHSMTISINGSRTLEILDRRTSPERKPVGSTSRGHLLYRRTNARLGGSQREAAGLCTTTVWNRTDGQWNWHPPRCYNESDQRTSVIKSEAMIRASYLFVLGESSYFIHRSHTYRDDRERVIAR